MKAKLLAWLAARMGVEAYFELLPLAQADWQRIQNQKTIGFPVFYNTAIFAESVWPKPGQTFRVFIQPVNSVRI